MTLLAAALFLAGVYFLVTGVEQESQNLLGKEFGKRTTGWGGIPRLLLAGALIIGALVSVGY